MCLSGLPGARGLYLDGVLLGAKGLCKVGGIRGHSGRFSPGIKFSHAMYKEARGAGLRKLVDKAIFGPILWWV